MFRIYLAGTARISSGWEPYAIATSALNDLQLGSKNKLALKLYINYETIGYRGLRGGELFSGGPLTARGRWRYPSADDLGKRVDSLTGFFANMHFTTLGSLTI